MSSADNHTGGGDLTSSNVRLTDGSNKTWRERSKSALKELRGVLRETTVEPCLFTYMLCTSLSSLAVQNMHIEKSCRVNFRYSDEVCDRINRRDTTGIEDELNQVQSLVARVVAWKFPLQTGIPAVMVLFVGAWSDRNKKRKICILFPMIGEIIANIGLLLATYYFYELSLTTTALIEALPAACTGSYIIIFMGMYSFMADRTSVENRTFRLGIVTICVSLGTPMGTALSGVALRMLGYYGMFSLLLILHAASFVYGLFRLEDIQHVEEHEVKPEIGQNKIKRRLCDIFGLVLNTVLVVLKPRVFNGRTQIILVLALYIIMVGPLYGDSQVAYLYAIRKFRFTEVEYSIYGAINIVLGLFGTAFCISVLSKRYNVQDSVIGCIAGLSRIAASLVFAFAPTREWYYSAPLFNVFSHTGLTAVRSIATKSVPTQEVAKLSSLVGVMEAIAPSVYMPTSSFIYVSTIDTFPGAFYLFDAALTIFALVFFSYIYILVRRRIQQEAVDPNKKEDFARANEVSRF